MCVFVLVFPYLLFLWAKGILGQLGLIQGGQTETERLCAPFIYIKENRKQKIEIAGNQVFSMLTSHPTFPLSLPTCISTLFLFPHPFFFVCCLHFCVGLSDETPLPCHFRREKNYNFQEKKGKDVQITKKTSALTLFVCGALRVFQTILETGF